MISVLSTCKHWFRILHPFVRSSGWTIGDERDPRTSEIANEIIQFHRVMFADASPAMIAHDRGFLNIVQVEMEVLCRPGKVMEALRCLRIEQLTIWFPDFLRPVGGDQSALAFLKYLTIKLPVSVVVFKVVNVSGTHQDILHRYMWESTQDATLLKTTGWLYCVALAIWKAL